jgi:hypothetical protein
MKKLSEQSDGSKMRAEYDFSRGVRGKHARRYAHDVKIRRKRSKANTVK